MDGDPTMLCMTDCFGLARPQLAGYDRLRHDVVRSTAEMGENLSPGPHRVETLLKRWLLGTHQGAVRDSHLEYYLDEFTFQFNRGASRSRGMLFYRLMPQAVAIDSVPAAKTGSRTLRACQRINVAFEEPLCNPLMHGH